MSGLRRSASAAGLCSQGSAAGLPSAGDCRAEGSKAKCSSSLREISAGIDIAAVFVTALSRIFEVFIAARERPTRAHTQFGDVVG